MPSGYRPDRETDFAGFPSTTPIVIDNGASTFRIGYDLPPAAARKLHPPKP
jgi:actin-related protein 5